MPTNEELRSLLFKAVRAYMAEEPRIGGIKSMEWPVSTRIAIHLARLGEVRAWESDHITVDAEYCQAGKEGALKGQMKPDIIVHRRGEAGRPNNWLACEIKLYRSGKPRRVHRADCRKLRRCKEERFGYQVAIWLALPRTREAGTQVFYSVFNENGSEGPIEDMPVTGEFSTA